MPLLSFTQSAASQERNEEEKDVFATKETTEERKNNIY